MNLHEIGDYDTFAAMADYLAEQKELDEWFRNRHLDELDTYSHTDKAQKVVDVRNINPAYAYNIYSRYSDLVDKPLREIMFTKKMKALRKNFIRYYMGEELEK